jgi:uncharacterized protein (TIGR00661 family)
MNGEKINIPGAKLRILIAPLDWGLGHATRCIPIIYVLLKARADVFIAGEGETETILKKEFPTLHFLPLKGYKINYSANKRSFLLKLMAQIPTIKRTIRYENNWLKEIISRHKIDGVISDNRFGLYAKTVPTVYITHQLHIETGFRWLNRVAQKIHYNYINRFGECWVPDVEEETNLAGILSRPKKLPEVPVKYLGILSRFSKKEVDISQELLVVLSGPEPQRTIFENLILQQLKDVQKPVTLVRGLPVAKQNLSAGKNVLVHNYLGKEDLNTLIQNAEIVLCRAGYSTIMDLATLQKKAILVATPGQAEQEYLATYLRKKNWFYSCPQNNFNLEFAIAQATGFYKTQIHSVKPLNENVINNWLLAISKIRV